MIAGLASPSSQPQLPARGQPVCASSLARAWECEFCAKGCLRARSRAPPTGPPTCKSEAERRRETLALLAHACPHQLPRNDVSAPLSRAAFVRSTGGCCGLECLVGLASRWLRSSHGKETINAIALAWGRQMPATISNEPEAGISPTTCLRSIQALLGRLAVLKPHKRRLDCVGLGRADMRRRLEVAGSLHDLPEQDLDAAQSEVD